MNIAASQSRGVLLVVSAPSGTGKSAVLRGVMEREKALAYSVSCTTRALRGDEVDGQSYYFISREEFEAMAEDGGFYEWAEVHGNCYGTPVEPVREAIGAGRDIALDIDVQGGLQVKEKCPEAVLVFLLPPSMEVLEGRLRGRATDSEGAIRLRMENARRELTVWPQYDYAIVNKDLGETIEAVRGVLDAERRRTGRISISDFPEAKA